MCNVSFTVAKKPNFIIILILSYIKEKRIGYETKLFVAFILLYCGKLIIIYCRKTQQ